MTGREIVRDEAVLVRAVLERELASEGVDAVITTGGTGIASRDTTFEAVSAPGVLAFPTVEPSANANLGEATGVALWDARIRDWRLNKMWVNDVIGWSK